MRPREAWRTLFPPNEHWSMYWLVHQYGRPSSVNMMMLSICGQTVPPLFQNTK